MEKSPKRRRITDFFQKLPNSDSPAPEMPHFLTRFEPTQVPRRKRSVGQPRRVCPESTDEVPTSSAEPDAQQPEEESMATRGVYRSYSLRQKIEIVRFARQNSEAAASRKYGVSRSTIYGIDKEPMAKVPVTTKGKHTKKGAGRQLTYSQCIDDELLSWILHQRDLQVTVRRLDIQLKAKALIGSDLPQFKASSGWVDKFMCLHSLSIR